METRDALSQRRLHPERETMTTSAGVTEPRVPSAAPGRGANPAASHPRATRRIVAEDPEWNLATVPRLAHLGLDAIVRNFEHHPVLDALLPKHRTAVLARISTQLPLTLAAALVGDEGYWRRRCQASRVVGDVLSHGNSWKRMFLERHLQALIELYVPDTTDPSVVREAAAACGPFVRCLDVGQLLPPIGEAAPAGDDSSDAGSDDGAEGPSVDHFDFGSIAGQLPHLEELHVAYGVRSCGMNFEWNLFEFTGRDCESLARAVKSCRTLRVLRLHRSRAGDEAVRALVRQLLDHPSLLVLDLSHNLVGDRGARALGKLLNRSRLTALNLCDNRVGGHGGQALAHAISRNATLRVLNLRLNRLGDEAGQALGRALQCNSSVVELYLGGNEMSEPTATALAHAVALNTSLHTIDLSCNRLGNDGGKQLQEGMSHNRTLTELDLRLAEAGHDSEYHISKILKQNREHAHRRGTTERAGV
ncbi:LOW QUALITY PROTEIN: dynein regulatory complex subunit 5-like [Lampetra planeri]